MTLNKEQHRHIQEMLSYNVSTKEVLEFIRELISNEQTKKKSHAQYLRFQDFWILLEREIEELKEVS